MPAHALRAEELKRRRDALIEALQLGFTLPGLGGPYSKGSAIECAARVLGINSGTLYKSWKRGDLKLDKPRVRVKAPSSVWYSGRASVSKTDDEGSTPSAGANSTERLADDLRRLRAELRIAQRHDLDAERVREVIFGLAGQTPEPPGWLVEPATATGGPGVPVTNWSDWHWGEVIKPGEVAGVNSFDLSIGAKRVKRLVQRTADLCYGHMVNADYPGVVVCLGGDMITGEIHDELAQTNALSTAPALLDVLGKLVWALTQMADNFGRVFVPCVVGNHGRMTAKPRAKGRVHTSYEWLLYTMLERHFADDERVQFAIPGETDVHFRVHGHRYVLTHGDALGVKGGDGIIGSLGPIARGRIKLHTSEAQIGREFDTLIIGHWHTYLPMPGLVVNGSLKGYDEYARIYLRARYQPPIQALWFTHPKRGVTCHWPVYLEDAVASADERQWVAWAA